MVGRQQPTGRCSRRSQDDVAGQRGDPRRVTRELIERARRAADPRPGGGRGACRRRARVDVLMLIKGVCEAARPFHAPRPADRQSASSTWSARRSAPPGTAQPLRGRAPTLEDLERAFGPEHRRPLQRRRRPGRGLTAGDQPRQLVAHRLARRTSAPVAEQRSAWSPRPARTPGLEVALDPRGHRLAAAVGVEPLEVEPEPCARAPTGADPRAGPGRRTAASCISQKRPCSAGGLGGARGRPRARVAGARPGSAGTRAAAGSPPAARSARRRTGTRSRRTRSPAGPPAARGRGRRGPAAGPAPSRARSPAGAGRDGSREAVEDQVGARADRRATAAW